MAFVVFTSTKFKKKKKKNVATDMNITEIVV